MAEAYVAGALDEWSGEAARTGSPSWMAPVRLTSTRWRPHWSGAELGEDSVPLTITVVPGA